MNNQIKSLKYKWLTWAENKCKDIDHKNRRNAYYHFAAVMCYDAIKKLLKKDK